MTTTRPILVALDFSPASSTIVDYAWNLAEAQAREIHFLHVLPYAVTSRDTSLAAYDDALKSLQALTGLPSGNGTGAVSFQHVVRFGTPAHEVIAMAKETSAGTIIMGTRGRSRLAHMVLGGVAEAVLREAPCPVLVVPETYVTVGFTDEPESQSEKVEATDARFLSESPNPTRDANRVVELLNRAIQWRASDVHIDPAGPDRVWIRFRVDGKLRTFCHLDHALAAPLMMQLKLMADFDTTQSFGPLEGRLKLPATLGMMEVRVTLVPACDGDAVAMRLLKHEALPRPLSMLGMSVSTLASVEAMLHHREGLVLVTGPTGSGKTTTVYAMLQKLGTGDRNIVSIEDPVEYRVAGIRQLSVNARHDFTMARGLRTLLRMDPDVVFIGEVRDAEALDIAMRASSSGRYVFTTLHTRDVASTITALRDLHADNYSLAANLSGIVSQRLIRCLCRECRVAVSPSDEQRQMFINAELDPPSELYQPRGCAVCQNSGYRDRVGIFEAVVITPDTMLAIQRGVTENELRQVIKASGAHDLAHDALTKARDGITSLEEACSFGWA
jgi:type II secretory ATPase GspE/PulE/Tfp pilus assembly ATPase PilB-like protein/nucleotide-binding universal stress UspA family protein